MVPSQKNELSQPCYDKGLQDRTFQESEHHSEEGFQYVDEVF